MSLRSIVAFRKAYIGTVLAVVALSVVGCSSSGPSTSESGSTAGSSAASGQQDLVKQAQSEGTVTVLTAATTSQMTPFVTAFQKQYGIRVQYQSLPSAQVLTRLNAELQSGHLSEDVVSTAETGPFTAYPQDFSSIASLSSLTDYPTQYKADKWAVTTIGSNLIIYNKNSVQQSDVANWTDLTSAKFKGKIVMDDPRISPIIASYYLMLEKKYGTGFLQKLGALQPTLVGSGTIVAQDVASGEDLVGFPVIPSALPGLLKSGAPIGQVTPDPTSGPIQIAGLSSSAAHPAAAKLLLNFWFSRAGQSAFNGDQLGGSPLTGITGSQQVAQTFQVPVQAVSTTDTNRLVSILGGSLALAARNDVRGTGLVLKSRRRPVAWL